MEYLNKVLDMPLVDAAVALVMGYLFARYQYKFNFINKNRHRVYLAKRFKSTRNTLFMPRDAFFATFIVKAVLTLTYGLIFAVVMILSNMIDLQPKPANFYVTLAIRAVSLIAMFSALYMHARSLFEMATEVRTLRWPQDALSHLRGAVLHSDKSEFLDESTKKFFIDKLDQWEELLSRPREDGPVSETKVAEPPAQQIPPPSTAGLPVQQSALPSKRRNQRGDLLRKSEISP
ncbi:hypothetical protein GOB43_17735 [Sinorhizobium meliloti]|nr:hypothetical protein [Sinorhizobium meliloti]